MKRIVDLTIKPYPAPSGDGGALARPVRQPTREVERTPEVIEPVTDEQSLEDVLARHEVNYAMSGMAAHEIFHMGMLTTKPYTSYVTFHDDSAGPTEPTYVSNLGATDLVGDATVGRLTDVDAAARLTADNLKSAFEDGVETDIALLETGYADHRPAEPDDGYLRDSPTLSEDAADWIVEQDVRLFGADVRSFNPVLTGAGEMDVHAKLNTAGVATLEDIQSLDEIEGSSPYVIVGLPIPARFATGGPARVLALQTRDQIEGFVDLSPPLNVYPEEPQSEEYPFEPPESTVDVDELGEYPVPYPSRIEPRDDFDTTLKRCRLTPFAVEEDGERISEEMYIEYGHGTTSHIEAAYFDPWGRHNVPDEILKRYRRMPTDKLVGPGKLLDLSETTGPAQQIDKTQLKAADPGLTEGDIALLRTDFLDWNFYGTTSARTPGLSPDAGEYLVEKGVSAVGIDAAIERSDPMPSNPQVKYTSNKVHYYLHKNDIPIAERLINMRLIKQDSFDVAICALSAANQGGFPAQVYVIEDA